MRKVVTCLFLMAAVNTIYGMEEINEHILIHNYGGIVIADMVTNGDTEFFESMGYDYREEIEQPLKEIPLSPPQFGVDLDIEIYASPMPIDVNLDLAPINHVVELLDSSNSEFCAIS